MSHFKAPPKKNLGQHFLTDRGIIEHIVHAVDPRPGDNLVEIGPGQGAITFPLLKKHGRLTVIEFDRDLITPLSEAAHGIGELTIVHKDVLQVDFDKLAGEGRIRLVGNLPYNISTPLLFHLLEQRDAIEDMHFMLQREVVERMCAEPGTKQYGRLTVMLAASCRVQSLFSVGPGAFRPPPRVQSAVVRLLPWRSPPFEMGDPGAFAMLVRQAFSMRRKTLKNALRGRLSEADIEAAGIDPGCRAETLEPAAFAALARRIPANGNTG